MPRGAEKSVTMRVLSKSDAARVLSEEDWRSRADEAIRYYSGTAIYRTVFARPGRLCAMA